MCNIDNPINCLANTSSVSYECKKLGRIHFLKQVLLPCNACAISLYTLTHVALVHAQAQLCNFRGVASGCSLFRVKNVRWSAVRRKILSAVRNWEASASRRLLMYYSYGSFNP